MKLKLDENLPLSLVSALQQLGHDVDSALSEGLAGKPDPVVWEASQDAGRFLITQDLDFSDIRRFKPGAHHGIILLRLHNPSRTRLAQRVLQLFRTEDVVSWTRCFVTATDHKIRLRRP